MATAELMPSIGTIDARRLEPGVYSVPNSMVLPPQSDAPVDATKLLTNIVPPEQLPEGRPSRVQFAALRDPRLRMKQAIPLDVTVEEGHVVVNWAAIDEFGSGDNLSAAIDDFAYALRALYRYLAGVEELGPDLANIKLVLGQYIEAR